MIMMKILVLELLCAAVVSQGHQTKPKRDILPACLWHPHRGGPDAGDHHGFSEQTLAFVSLGDQSLRRSSACSWRLQQL